MLAKIILVSAICSFVFVRSIESRGTESLSLFDKAYPDKDMVGEATKIEEKFVLQVPAPLTKAKVLPRSIETVGADDQKPKDPETKQPKKRATKDDTKMKSQDDHETNPRPGCCG